MTQFTRPVGAKSWSHPWYKRSCWVNGFRIAQLQREPICQYCQRAAATVVDHKIPFIQNGVADWELFSSPSNHQSLCKPCHDAKTAREDRFGRAGRTSNNGPKPVATGDAGRQFVSSSVDTRKVDAALDPAEISKLLEGL